MEDRRNDRWTAEDALRMEAMTAAGATEAEIAAALGRTEKAINKAKHNAGLTHRPPEYRITAPDGAIHSADSLNDFVVANVGMTEDFSVPAKGSRASMGLQWALRTGRKWKGWLAEEVEAGSRKRSDAPRAETLRRLAPVPEPRRARWMCSGCGGSERSARSDGKRRCVVCVPPGKPGPKAK